MRGGLNYQRGSAYLIALLALVVLTIIGLSLSLITQTELELGSNQRTLNRVFYAANSGISTSTARALTSNDTAARTITLPEPEEGVQVPDLDFQEVVETTPFFPILDAPCNLCGVNGAGNYGANTFRRTTFAVTSSATRQLEGTESLSAQKILSAMVDVQPRNTSVSAFVPITDPDQLAKIRF